MAEVYDGRITDLMETLPGITIAVERAAADIKTRSQVIAASESDTGNFARSFKVAPVPDRPHDHVVYNDDPAASFIEAGHVDRSGVFHPGKMTMWRAMGGSWS